MKHGNTEAPTDGIPTPQWIADLQGKQLRVITKLLLAALLAGMVMGALHYAQGRQVTGILLVALGLTAGSLLVLALRSRITPGAIHLSMAIVMLILFLVSIISGKETPASAMLFGLPSFLFAAVGERRAMAIWSIVGLCALALLYRWPSFGIEVALEIPGNFPLVYFSVAAILLVLISLIGYMLVDAQRLLLKELAATNAQIADTMKLAVSANESKQQFLARMSHELRTPLNAILGFCQILTNNNKQSALTTQQRTNIHHIEASGTKLLELVDEILDITKQTDSGYIETTVVELWPLLNLITSTHQIKADQKSIKLIVSSMDNIRVQCDPKQLGRVMDQLISNAIAFNRHYGIVTIDAVVENDCINVSVADSGHGMTARQMEAVFAPFGEQDKRFAADQGAGVGLALVKKLVEQMHGTISVTSELGKGSRFVITLPRARPPLQTANVRPAQTITDPVGGNPVTASKSSAGVFDILYVEDAPLNVLLMEALFEELPQFRLCIATTGVEARKVVATINPWLLLLDLNLPDIHGIDLLAQLREDHPLMNVDAIAVSADATQQTIDRALTSGFAAYWVKPVNLDTIRNALLRRIHQ